MTKSNMCRWDISILLYEFYKLKGSDYINDKHMSDLDDHGAPDEHDINGALMVYFPWVLILKLIMIMQIPFVVWKLQQKKKKTKEPMNPPPVPYYDETYCVFAVKLINTYQVFLVFIFN